MRILPALLCISVASLLLYSCNDDEPSAEHATTDGVEDSSNSTGDNGSYVPDDVVIEEYNGELADDIANDVVGDSEDFFWENNDFTNEITVVFAGSTATVESSSKKVNYNVQGAYVTIDMETEEVSKCKITASGASDNGQLKIYGTKKFMLELSGLDLTCQNGPAINNQCKKRVFIHLDEGSYNYLTDAENYSDDLFYLDESAKDDEDRKGCFFSEGNMIFSGAGALVVSGKHKHAIATDNYFYMRPGVTIVVQEAVSNGIQIKGDDDDTYGDLGFYITGGYIYANIASDGGKCIKTDKPSYISGGKLRLYTTGSAIYDDDDADISSATCIKVGDDLTISGGDLVTNSTGSGAKGISVDGNLYITGGDISAATSGDTYTYTSSLTTGPKPMKADGDIIIDGGTLNLSATGNSSKAEALSSDATLTINGGDIFVYAYDDGMSIHSDITINGGRIFAYSESNDGIDSNTSITINGGLIIASSTNGPEEGLDTDDSRNFLINGGTIVATGGSQSSPSSSSGQKVVICNNIKASKDETFAILDSSSQPLLTYELPRSMSGMSLLFSSADLTSGSYTVETNGTISDWTDSWYGWYDGATWSGGTPFASFTVSSTITTVGSSSSTPGNTPSMGGMGSMGGPSGR